MYLVTKGKRNVNVLGYDAKKGEYVCIHEGKEVWREKGDKKLLDYFTNLHATNSVIDDSEVAKYPIWIKYCESCQKFEKAPSECKLDLLKKQVKEKCKETKTSYKGIQILIEYYINSLKWSETKAYEYALGLFKDGIIVKIKHLNEVK